MHSGQISGCLAGHVDALGVAGLLLDVGQLGVTCYIADKPSILTVDEIGQMRRHPDLGARIIERVPGMSEVVSWVESHHERPDGRGYPEMLTGADCRFVSSALPMRTARSGRTARIVRRSLPRRRSG